MSNECSKTLSGSAFGFYRFFVDAPSGTRLERH